MAQQIVTIEDLYQFRLQLLEDLKVLIQPANNSVPKGMVKKAPTSVQRTPMGEDAGLSYGTLQNLRIKRVLPYLKLGGIMFYRYEDIGRMLDGDKLSRIIALIPVSFAIIVIQSHF